MGLEPTERLTNDEEDNLTNKLSTELKLAQVDYMKKKRLKGELVDRCKMRKAINGRKHIQELNNKLLGSILGKGIDFLKEINTRSQTKR